MRVVGFALALVGALVLAVVIWSSVVADAVGLGEAAWWAPLVMLVAPALIAASWLYEEWPSLRYRLRVRRSSDRAS